MPMASTKLTGLISNITTLHFDRNALNPKLFLLSSTEYASWGLRNNVWWGVILHALL